MEIITVVFGLASLISLVFAILQYLKGRTGQITEEAKARLYQERIRSLRYDLIAAREAANGIVQRSKTPTFSADEARALARSVRTGLTIAVRKIEVEQESLRNWTFGRFDSHQQLGPNSRESSNEQGRVSTAMAEDGGHLEDLSRIDDDQPRTPSSDR